jgi:hypothetical protein
VTIHHVHSFPENLVDILTSPKEEGMHVATISETEELVTKTLKDLRREFESIEEVNEKEILEPINSLTKHRLVLKFERLAKQNE